MSTAETTRPMHSSSAGYAEFSAADRDRTAAWGLPDHTEDRGVDCGGRADKAVTVSSHADLRWLQRTHDFDSHPIRAWQRGTAVRFRPDEFDRVRYDQRTGTLLCVKETTIVTILLAEYESFVFEDAGHGTGEPCSACGTAHGRDTESCPTL